MGENPTQVDPIDELIEQQKANDPIQKLIAMKNKMQADLDKKMQENPEKMEIPKADGETSAAIPSIGPNTPRVCPSCGWLVNEIWHPNLDDNVKMDFLEKVVIQGGRWSQSYPLFGGKMIVEFRTLTGMEAKVAMDMALTHANPPRLLDVFRYEMSCAVASLTRDGKIQTFPEIDSLEAPLPWEQIHEQMLDRFNKVITRWTMPLYSVIQRRYNQFEITHTHLTSKAADMDFWKATP